MNKQQFYAIGLARKVFLRIIRNFIRILAGTKQWKIKAKLKISAAEFKRKSYKFILKY